MLHLTSEVGRGAVKIRKYSKVSLIGRSGVTVAYLLS